jgi:hypothetical protein
MAEESQNPRGDASHHLDLVTVFRSAGAFSDFQAISIRALLESNGIPAVLVGDSRLPNLDDEVRVPRDHAERARQLIAEARAAGPSAAEEAEAAGESEPRS